MGRWLWAATLGGDGPGGGLPTAFAAAPAKSRLRAPPPIDCDNKRSLEKETIDVLQLRAAGERAQGRSVESPEGAPAEEELERRLAAKGEGGGKGAVSEDLASAAEKRKKELQKAAWDAAKKLGRDLEEPPPLDDGRFEGLESKVVAKTPLKIEKVWMPKHGKEPKPKHKVERLPPPLHAAKLPSRHEIIFQGPFPLEKRMAELAAHAYYLWGDSRFVLELAGGTRSEKLARNLERFAKSSDTAARAMIREAHIPVSREPPNLPMEVSAAPPALLAWALGAAGLQERGQLRGSPPPRRRPEHGPAQRLFL